MDWLITIAVGLVAGALGKLLMPGKDPGGCLITILLGIAGAILGKFIAGLLGYDVEAGQDFSLPSLAISVGGVIVLLLVYRLTFAKKKE
ncbi:MAG: GlsB/YeaQ/YmgE family stress response membrane protein [Verrucomicrobiales bacterium]